MATTAPLQRRTKIGRPSALTDDVADAIVRAIEQAVPYNAAAASAGIAPATFHRWIARGADEQDRQDAAMTPEQRTAEGLPPEDDEEPYRDFRERAEIARGKAVARNALNIQQAARGGFTTKTTKRTLPNGTIEEETVVTAPDWRAADRFLRYAAPDWAATQQGPAQVELTGAGGGPVQVESTERLEALSVALAARLAAGSPGVLAAVEDVQDAEVVEEGSPAGGDV